MTAMQRKRFYQTREWRAMSRHIRQRDGWLCAGCKPRTVAAELVHHIVPLSENGRPFQNQISSASVPNVTGLGTIK